MASSYLVPQPTIPKSLIYSRITLDHPVRGGVTLARHHLIALDTSIVTVPGLVQGRPVSIRACFAQRAPLMHLNNTQNNSSPSASAVGSTIASCKSECRATCGMRAPSHGVSQAIVILECLAEDANTLLTIRRGINTTCHWMHDLPVCDALCLRKRSRTS